MPQRKAVEDGKSQREKFIEAARQMGADGDEDMFRRAVRKVATAPVTKPKKATRRPKG